MILIKHNNEGNLKPYFYFALEEYILKHLLKNDEAYFFTWKIKGVVIGKHQVIENEVNMDYLNDNNIDLYRRPSGGGTIYADEYNTMFSMITKKTNNFSFKPYLSKVIDSVKKLGLDLEFSGRNDLLFDGKKVSGVAFLQNKYGVLIHGTFMYDVDIKTMVKSITPNNEKLISKGIDSVRSRVVNLKEHLNDISEKELFDHIESDITTSTYYLSNKEIKEINELAKKYEDHAWRFLQQPNYQKVLKKRIKGGMFNISLDLSYGEIKDIKITGDFFDILPVNILENKLVGITYDRDSIKKVLDEVTIEDVLLDIDKNEFYELLISGIL